MINSPFLGARLAAYRDNTARHAKMAGVTRPSFQCKRCRFIKGVPGRKTAVAGTVRYGWVCKDCVEAESCA